MVDNLITRTTLIVSVDLRFGTHLIGTSATKRKIKMKNNGPIGMVIIKNAMPS